MVAVTLGAEGASAQACFLFFCQGVGRANPSRKGYAFSAANQLILNFKKSMNTRHTAQWRYKEQAIGDAAAAFRAALNKDWLNTATLVPLPPSKAKSDALYDDRLDGCCGGFEVSPALMCANSSSSAPARRPYRIWKAVLHLTKSRRTTIPTTHSRRRQHAARDAHADHEGECRLHLLAATFGAQVAVVLQVHAVKLH
jgi:hypothetical protein